MASDIGQHVRKAVVSLLDDPVPDKAKDGPLSGGKGVVAGAGLALLAPLAGKGISKLAKSKLGGRLQVPSPKEAVNEVGSKVSDAMPSAGDVLPGPLGGSGGSDGDGDGAPSGTGSGRRMPIQQSMDVAVPVQTAYNQWTQFEEWPRFMHRLERVEQQDDCTVTFGSKIWGINKTFEARIIEQYPDERIKWEVENGPSHVGVVTFHPLAERLTRIELDLDVDPDSMLEKAGRGMRFVKRAVRGDMHRFKAFLELNDEETGAWRGVIEDGEVVEQHDEGDTGEQREEPQQKERQDGDGDEEQGMPRPPRPPRTPAMSG
ncbi:MAG TPA: SRPBCC family protein [Thermoleophilaceae bacterium]|nr:SRPBCC family protein [Thermoleophilaceae bacterium]